MRNRPLCAAFLWTSMVLLLLPSLSRAQEQPPGQGLSLEQAVTTVLQRSPMTEAADANLAAAEQGKLSVRGQFLPKLQTQMDYTNQHGIPEVQVPAMVPGGQPVTFPAGTEHVISSKTTLQQPVFTGLALLSQYRLSDVDRRRAEVTRTDTRQGLILQTYETYYGVLVTQKALGVADQAVTQLESHAEVARQFFQNGMIPKNDLLKTLVSMADTRRKRIEAAHSLDLSWSRLRTLLRMDEAEGPLRLTQELNWSPYGQSLEDCIAVALNHQPGVLLTRLDVEKADRSVTLARSAYFPKISVMGMLDHEEGGFVETEHLYSGTVHAEWAVWEWGTSHFKVEQSKSMLRVAKARNTQEEDSVKLQVRAAFLDLKEWEDSIKVAEATIEQAEENYRITVDQYNENVTTSTEVLDAQTLQAQAQMNYYTALTNYNISMARLQRAMGTLQEPGT